MENNLVARLSKSFRQNLRSYTLVIALALIWLIFGIAKPSFWSPDNVANVIRQMGIIAIMACGMVFVIVTGGIDLSVGYGAGFVSVIAAYLQYYILDGFVVAIIPGIDPAARAVVTAAIAVILSIGVGVIIGFLQGAVVAYLGVPAFIVTLGGMFVFKSGVLLVTNGLTIKINNRVFANLAQGSLPPLAGIILAILVSALIFAFVLMGRKGKRKYGIEPKSLPADIFKAAAFSALIFAYVLIVNVVSGVPVLVVILGCIAIFMSYLSMNTRFGRYTYAIGGNREAARLSGINIKKTLLRVFVAMGTLTGIAGVMLAADVAAGTTGAGGGYELDVIASCILGGTSTLGGEGTVFGALVGALIMQSLTNGLQMVGINSNWQYLIKGLVLILAVYADIQMKKKKKA